MTIHMRYIIFEVALDVTPPGSKMPATQYQEVPLLFCNHVKYDVMASAFDISLYMSESRVIGVKPVAAGIVKVDPETGWFATFNDASVSGPVFKSRGEIDDAVIMNYLNTD